MVGEFSLVLWCGDAGERANLAIGELGGAQVVIDDRKLAQRSRDADTFARGRDAHADAP